MDKPSPVKMGLLLLGSFILAYLAAETLHELCHSGAAILTGGHSSGIVVDPFNWSYSSSYSFQHPVIHTAAGALGSSFIALFLFVLLIRWPKPVMLPLLLIGPITLINNGEYWAWDIITGSGMDACNLAEGGISPWLLLSAGIVQCILGIILAVYLMCRVGLTNQTFKNRLIVFAIGIIPYALAGVFWNWYSGVEILWDSAIGYAVFFAVITGIFKTKKSTEYNIRWSVAAGYTVLGAVLVIVLSAMAVSPKSTVPSLLNNNSTTRPDNFPDVLRPHRLAMEPFYAFPPPMRSVKHYLLSYSLPEDANLQQIRNDLKTLCREHNYIQLYHEMDVSSKPLDDNWKEEISKVGFKTVRVRSYSQQWIKLSPEVSYVYLSVHDIRRGNKSQTTGVMMAAGDESNIDEVLLYVDMHPEGFNWFEVGQLRIKALFGFNDSQPPVIMGQ